MRRKQLIDEIALYFARFNAEIQVYARLDLTDINKISEDVLVPILAAVYGYHGLMNLNTSDWYNFPAVDLGDDTARVAIQVTSQTGSSKVIQTLAKFREHNLSDRFDHLIIYILGNKSRLTSSKIDSQVDASFRFDKKGDYRDHSDILQTISSFDIEQLEIIRDILEANFGDHKVSLSEIENRLDESLSNQLTRIKKSRKYVPRLFVEVSETKDKARYFVHPLLFFNRVLKDINRLHFKPMNRFLEQLSLEPVVLNVTVDMIQVNDIVALDTKSQALLAALEEVRLVAEQHYINSTKGKNIEDLPEHLAPLGDKLRYALATSSHAVQRDLEKLQHDLKLLSAKVLFIISRAGQGKTNFVCDLAENVLAKRSIPTIFMTGQELNSIAPKDFSNYLLKEAVAGDHHANLMISRLDELGKRKGCPVTIIIDGINEHAELKSFSAHLERFCEEIVKHPYLKIILTCREEYFEERFSNFKHASFNDQIVFLENFNLRMSEKHKEHMVKSYFQHFRLDHSHVSHHVVDKLQSDTLLLRMFCECYGNPDSDSLVDLQQVHDIYRYEIFQRYLARKLENITHRRDQGGIGIGNKLSFQNALNEVIRLMIESELFTNLRLSDIDPTHLDALNELVGEDIILRVDLSDELDPFNNRYEVLNFTFDEFRDYLVASYLVNNIFKNDPPAFHLKLTNLINPEIPIAEGIKKYIFIASRQPAGRAIDNLISQQKWFEQTFIENIFSINDNLIQDEDTKSIRRLFCTNPRNTSWIISSLIIRWDTERYANLNITTLFEILEDMDVEAFDDCIDPAFGRYSQRGYDESNLWTIDHLCDQVREKGFQKTPQLVIELLIYFTGIQGQEHTYPAFRTLQNFVEDHPVIALDLLSRHINARNIRVQAQVWRLLANLRNSQEIPESIEIEAQKRLAEIQSIPVFYMPVDEHLQVLERDIKWFLEGRGIGEGRN